MIVIELIKKYGLEDYKKQYKNVYGNQVDVTSLTFAELVAKEVKGVYINFPTKECDITIL